MLSYPSYLGAFQIGNMQLPRLKTLITRLITVSALSVGMISLGTTAARAEMRIDLWKTYGAMAEQGAVCAAFARLMELQSMVDEKNGLLWLERRKYAGAVVRQAAMLEGVTEASAEDIDGLINGYSMWLVSNLSEGDDANLLDPEAHLAATKMVRDVCSTLYSRADVAIFERLPSLAPATNSCPTPSNDATGTATVPAAQCSAEEVDEDKKRQVTALLRNNMALSAEVERLRTALEDSEAKLAANIVPSSPATSTIETASDLLAVTPPSGDKTGVAIDQPAVSNATDLPLPKRLPEPKPETFIQKMARNTITTNNQPQKEEASNLFVAQLGSYRTSEAAEAGIDILLQQFPAELDMVALKIEPNMLQNGQILHRITTEGLGRTQAADICEALWAKKFGCLIKVIR